MIASYKYVKSTNLNALKKQSDITLSITSDEMMNIFDARGQSYKNDPLCNCWTRQGKRPRGRPKDTFCVGRWGWTSRTVNDPGIGKIEKPKKSFSDFKNSNLWYQKMISWYQEIELLISENKVDFFISKIEFLILKNHFLISRNRILDIRKWFSDIKKKTRNFLIQKMDFLISKIQILDIKKPLVFLIWRIRFFDIRKSLISKIRILDIRKWIFNIKKWFVFSDIRKSIFWYKKIRPL